MNEFYVRNVIEAALLAAGKALQLAEIGQIFDENTRPKVDDLRATLDALAAEYAGRGIEVKETAAGFRIQVRREFGSEISRLWPERPARYSRALLETLALIAYRQPITRAEIEAVRGVAVNPNIIKTVIERNWVRVVGHRDVPGRPELLGTTREFLDYFGLRSLDELPPLAELKAMGDYNLQLELPNELAPDGEVKADDLVEGEGAAPVVALLTSETTANTDDASADIASADSLSADGAAADAVSTDPNGADDAAHEAVADAGVSSGEASHDPGAAHDLGAGHDHDAGAGTESAGDAVAHDADASINSAGDAVAHDADASINNTGDTVAHSDAPDAHGTGEVAHGSDDSDALGTLTSNESSDALDDSADDDDADDELSANGHDSRELVAAPRDFDD
jgi:segregation and condensation protein B